MSLKNLTNKEKILLLLNTNKQEPIPSITHLKAELFLLNNYCSVIE